MFGKSSEYIRRLDKKRKLHDELQSALRDRDDTIDEVSSGALHYQAAN